MKQEILVNVTQAEGHDWLQAFISDRCAPQKHVWRAYNAEGCGTTEIIR